MKALFVSAAVFTAALAAPHPVRAGSVSIGNSTASDCYESAVARTADRNAFYHCNLALAQEGLGRDDHAATLVNRGVLHLRNRNYPAAGRDFESALKLDPNNAEAWLNIAIVRLQQGGGDETLPMIDKSLALDTSSPALAYYSRSIAHERAGNLRAAYNDLQRAHQLAPKWREPSEDLKRYQVRRR